MNVGLLITLIVVGGIVLIVAFFVFLVLMVDREDRRKQRELEKERMHNAYFSDDYANKRQFEQALVSWVAPFPQTLPTPSCRCSECDAPIWLGTDYLCSDCRLTDR